MLTDPTLSAELTVEAQVRVWVINHPLTPEQVDCATTVMLKVLDGKCKMPRHEKVRMSWLYDAVKHQPGELLGDDTHALIVRARQCLYRARVQSQAAELPDESLAELDPSLTLAVYERRLLAETRLTRPVMKAFKRWIRQQGLLPETLARQSSTSVNAA
ncbi:MULTISPECIES: hypothetical protein [unclassified Oceanobacter]|jgi:hypothetical protein|uniref:hypothetical protein n=1 Tax=unclassified Oceanobacter TaxID=2620260 RepID=UPI0026E3A699|nr:MULTISPECIES: hypothetical protein [unclassified Oceanobacter]MDO6681700.1 hypothetical protein [Oceanobacter sp. 5_MG-2023]MDP2505672.1 hypothetical protein [Oceanobacter sp. 3_MG-2023]MDP2547501.1 hypothetical protein [Oceanobacter sp. 4_MG-2023]